MGVLRAGVFGVGSVAIEYMKAVQANSSAEVAAVVGRDKKKTQARVEEAGIPCEVLESYSDLIKRDDIDIIINTAPHFLHAEQTIQAAEAGKHVICEKPIGMNPAEVRKVYEAVSKAGVVFQCGMVLRWSPYILTIKHMIDSGMLGKVFYLEVDYFHKLASFWNGFTWGGQNREGGPSASLVAGIHAVDLMRYLCGEVEHVFANGVWGHRDDFGYPPTYLSAVAFKNGAVGKTSCSFEIESPYLVNTLIHGSKGSVANDKFFLKETFPGQTGWQTFETIMPDSGAVSHHPFKYLVDDAISAILTGHSTVLNIEETFRTHEVCMAIDQSAESGKLVRFPFL